MSDVESPKSSDESSDASSAAGAGGSAAPTAGGADEIDINFGDPEAAPAADAGKSAAAKSASPVAAREPESVLPAQSQRASTTGAGERRSSAPVSSVREDRLPSVRGVEMASSEQKKLEDIRRKLKDIFVTGEKQEPAADTVKATSDQQTVSSGLLDLRHLAEARHGNRESTKVNDDDMMHLSGGLFGGARSAASLAAPDLTKPTAPAPKPPPPVQAAKPVTLTDDAVMDLDPEPDSAPRRKAVTKPPATTAPVVAEPEPDFRSSGMSGRTIVALTIGAAVLFGGVFFMVMRGGGDEATEPVSSAADANANAQPTAEQGQRVGQPSGDTPPPAADPGGAAVVPGTKPAADEKTSKSGDSASTKGTGSKATAEPKEPKEPAAPGAKPETTAATPPPTPAQTEAPKAPPPPPVESGNEFDAGAARAAMNAAASRAMSCKGDGPAGTASVSVTFAPSGRATSAKVESGPFSGTPAGGCIATAFRSATVPPFSGSSVTVRKTVSLR